jgi:E3 ubiquitin-protein ligase HUWE1
MSGFTKFTICKSHEINKLPMSHTCFNQLDLPEYGSLEEMEKKLRLAIKEGKEGFGFL